MKKEFAAFLKLTGNRERNYVKVNLLFIFIFLNIWDFAINRDFFNGMILGVLMFAPIVFLWIIGTVRAAALITILSILEFVVMAIFLAQAFALSGLSSTQKSIFGLPYVVAAGVNCYWGLKIYNQYRDRKIKEGESL